MSKVPMKRQNAFQSAGAFREREEVYKPEQQEHIITEPARHVDPVPQSQQTQGVSPLTLGQSAVEKALLELQMRMAKSGKASAKDLAEWGMADLAPGYNSRKFAFVTGHSFPYAGNYELVNDTCLWCGLTMAQLYAKHGSTEGVKALCPCKPEFKKY